MVAKVLIDQGNSMDILYWKTFQRLEMSPTMIQPHYGPNLGFAGESRNQRLRGLDDQLPLGQTVVEFHGLVVDATLFILL